MELQEIQDGVRAKVRQAMEAKGWKPYRLAKESGIRLPHIVLILAGHNICLDSIRKLSKALEVHPKFFFDWE